MEVSEELLVVEYWKYKRERERCVRAEDKLNRIKDVINGSNSNLFILLDAIYKILDE